MKKMIFGLGVALLLRAGFAHAIPTIEETKEQFKDGKFTGQCSPFVGEESAKLFDKLTPAEQEQLCKSCNHWWKHGAGKWESINDKATWASDYQEYAPISQKCDVIERK